jgi:hypothetical protein
MSHEEEALGDLFVGVLPGLRLHLNEKLTDCLCCGNKVTLSDLAERVELVEQYISQAMESRRIRLQERATATGFSFAQEREVLLAWGWDEKQLERMTDASKLLILNKRLQGRGYSIRKDGSIFDPRKGCAITA